jgi:hypothetical protein
VGPPAAPDRNPARLLFVLKPGPPRLWFAARAAVCMAVPVLVGWAAGEIASGLLATIGAFTALYGANRPYLYRAGFLAALAVSLAVFVALGDWAAALPWAGVLTVCVVAVVATFVCNALAVGPPGAYMLVLACAAGTGLSGSHLSPWRVGVLVLAGGAFAWLVHMAGALTGFRRPERAAVAAGAAATARYIEVVGTTGESTARHQAAQALHSCWLMLVSFQPGPRSTPTLDALRVATLRLHALFAETMRTAAVGGPVPAGAAAHALGIGALTDTGVHVPGLAGTDRIPLGRPGRPELLRRAAAPGSATRMATLRVGVAAVLAGYLALSLGLDHAYWAIAAAVLVLHQRFDWIRTVERGVERLVGTLLGLVLAGIVLTVAPHGIWLAVTLAVLQFVVELLVIRNYTLATVFITPLALTIAFGARPVDDVAALLAARGIDTVIGCVVALLVFAALGRRPHHVRTAAAVARSLRAVAAVAPYVAEGTVGTAAARADRRDLQLALMDMQDEYGADVGGSEAQRRSAERLWPAVVATEDLGYRVLAACWDIEHDAGAGSDVGLSEGLDAFTAAVRDLGAAIEAGTSPSLGLELPKFGAAELHRLRGSIVGEPN